MAENTKIQWANHWHDSEEFGFRQVPLTHPKGGDMSEWPVILQRRELPQTKH